MDVHNHLLVIGYGNTLRSDDGVGVRVADAVEQLDLPGVRTLSCQQLSPEHAAAITQAHTVVFVDASIETPDHVHLRQIHPSESSQLLAHAANPGLILALARDVFGHTPTGWWLTIPAKHLEFGESLSPETTRGFTIAIEKIRSLQSKTANGNA